MREMHHMGRDTSHYVALFVTPTWQRSYGTEPYPSWAKPTITAWHVYPVSDDQFIAERARLA
jgi:hypothetical protein